MVGKREKPEDIVTKLRQVEVLHGQGLSMADAVRQSGYRSTRSTAGGSSMAGWTGLSCRG